MHRSWALLPSTQLRGETNEVKVEDKESLGVNHLGMSLGPSNRYRVITKTIGKVEAVEAPVARTAAATLVIEEDQKRNEALQGLVTATDAHERSMKRTGMITTMTGKVEDTNSAAEDFLWPKDCWLARY